MDAGSESHRQESGPRGCVICAKIGKWLSRVLSVGRSLQTPFFGGGDEILPLFCPFEGFYELLILNY